MLVVKRVLEWITRVIQLLLAAILLYFPAAELLRHLGREAGTRRFRSTLAVEDSLLPCLTLALAYALVSAILRMIEPARPSQGNTHDPDGD